MEIKLESEKMNCFPKLAWLAVHDKKYSVVKVYHGESVETTSEWVVEGVWDDEFAKGNFHKSENFFGSGVRIEDGKVFYVPSSALVDRLIYTHLNNRLYVSNSLLCLLSFVDAKLDKNQDYVKESFTILEGVKRYDPTYKVVHESLDTFYQLFHYNYVVEGQSEYQEDRFKQRRIDDFESYYDLLRRTIDKLNINLCSKRRKFEVIKYTTMSTGYDSTAVSALVKDLDIKKCFLSRKSNSILPRYFNKKITIDDGTPIALKLGLDTEIVDVNNIGTDELYLLASSSAGPELIYHHIAKYIEEKSNIGAVFTGYHGDVVFDLKLKPKESGDDLVRGDTSGLNLTEIRLKAGIIHVAVPFMYARNIEQLIKISHSEEMNTWRMWNNYDRPIPRRILESAGVDRQLFGVRKKGITKYYSYPKNPKLKKEYFSYIKREFGMSPYLIYFYDYLVSLPVLLFNGLAYNLGFEITFDKNTRPGLNFSRKMYVWATNKIVEKMRNKISKREENI